ncbi:hypothetical protein CIT26_00460 [Mesorhizobium temperatum]|uniref:Uncharacterized protein n=1 Tax=Mesorhizobium temperatum TaxID=241416 RepID=A0A271LZ55_9HYPH|nr:hypothetical protein CIT26_00460 [Mesorhizobium temperatum]
MNTEKLDRFEQGEVFKIEGVRTSATLPLSLRQPRLAEAGGDLEALRNIQMKTCYCAVQQRYCCKCVVRSAGAILAADHKEY